jgi:hypothetical protein
MIEFNKTEISLIINIYKQNVSRETLKVIVNENKQRKTEERTNYR